MSEKAVPEAEELPKTIVRRLVKDKLSQLSKEGDVPVFRDALQAFSESSRIFIQYLAATANDICKESKRQIVNAEDVFKALEEIEFPEFIEPLKASLEEYKRKNAVKRVGSSEAKEAKNSKKKEQATEEAKETKKSKRKERPTEKGKESKKSKTKLQATKNGGEKKKISKMQ